MTKKTYDEVGPWSEIKHEILVKYAAAYSGIVGGHKLHPIYIDGFAGSGKHKRKHSGEEIPGSPTRALEVNPPFMSYHFVDSDPDKVAELKKLTKKRDDVCIYEGDCNKVLPEQVFPKARYEDFCRALCFLDPYGLHLNWEVIHTAGTMKSIEIFLNFPIMDINMNVLLHDRTKVDPQQAARLTAFWGDESWKLVAYEKARQPDMFDDEAVDKVSNERFAEAFRERLKTAGGFAFVAKPMAMVNSTNNTVYFLYFATQNQTGHKIVNDIFKKYKYVGRA